MSESLESTDEGTIAFSSLEGNSFEEILKGKTVLGIVGSWHALRNAEIHSHRRSRDAPAHDFGCRWFERLCRQRRPFSRPPIEISSSYAHPGEMGRLLGIATLASQADASQWRLMRHGAGTRILSSRAITHRGFPGRQTFVSTTGNAGLRRAARAMSLRDPRGAYCAVWLGRRSARTELGVYLHGLAAESATRGTDLSGLLAGEVADAVPDAG